MREFVGFFLRDLRDPRDLRGGSIWVLRSKPRLANDHGLAGVNDLPPKRALRKRYNRLRMTFSHPKEGVSVPRDCQGYCDKPSKGGSPGYVEVGLWPTGTTVLASGGFECLHPLRFHHTQASASKKAWRSRNGLALRPARVPRSVSTQRVDPPALPMPIASGWRR